MTSPSPIHPQSFLGYLCAHQPMVTSTGKPLARLVPLHSPAGSEDGEPATQSVIISIDNGNDALKGTMLHAREPRLASVRIATAYAPARTLRAGEGVTTWQVNGSEPFWIGDDALVADQAESLPIGMTEERLADQRFRHYFYAGLIELLIRAGYGVNPGEWQGYYDLYLGIPPEELDLRGPMETVRRALSGLLHTPCHVRRYDEQGQVTTWTAAPGRDRSLPPDLRRLYCLVLYAGRAAYRDRDCQAHHPRYRGRSCPRLPGRSPPFGSGPTKTENVRLPRRGRDDWDGARCARGAPRTLCGRAPIRCSGATGLAKRGGHRRRQARACR
jgi:antitoxin (DNA-binding transcriptional repressor) of toxin-antitoxin stability system